MGGDFRKKGVLQLRKMIVGKLQKFGQSPLFELELSEVPPLNFLKPEEGDFRLNSMIEGDFSLIGGGDFSKKGDFRMIGTSEFG